MFVRLLLFTIDGQAHMVSMDNVNRRRNLGFFFDQAAARVPDKAAIIDLFGGRERRSTYRQLDARMDAMARMLARLGVRPGERVAMLIGNRTEFIEFFFGAMRAGAILLPLNTRLAGGTLERIIADAACVLAVVDPASHRDALALARRLPLRRRLLLIARRRASLFEEETANRALRSSRLRSPTMRRRSSPIPPGRPAGPRARS
jgi:acyl-CoA synthetase (AMP-forming)/AMP-acid ligase II